MSRTVLVRADAPFRPDRPLRVPGDKSISHRALLLSAVAHGTCSISGLPSGLDVTATLRCVRALGARTETVGRHMTVASELTAPTGPLDCGNSGTTMRLLCGLLAGRDFESALDGDGSLRRRPMRRVTEPIGEMGGRVDSTDGHAPLLVVGSRLRGIDHHCPVPSAQVKGALLLAGLQAEGETVIRLPAPSRDHTERLLGALGLPVHVAGTTVSVSRADVPGFALTVPGDLSSAAFAFAAAAVSDGAVVIEGVGLNPTRDRVLGVLADMGADVEVMRTGTELGEPVGTVRVAGPLARGFSLDAAGVADAVDEIPVLCAAAATVPAESVIHGAAELRVKESDRLATVSAMLRAFGVGVEERDDGLTIGGRPDTGTPGPARVDAAGDHRIALAAAVAACGLGPALVEGWDASAVSYPEFAADLRKGGVHVAVVA